jgi:aryl-alcohol dehydrogenase-like predicted oxidoreductase
MLQKNKLALGTAQFGFNYGVANRKGKVSQQEIARILDRARKSGIDTLDTAVGYGEAEAELGRTDLSSWQVVTKLPGIPDGQTSIAQWISDQVTSSIKRLGISRLSGMLLHRASDFLGANGDQIDYALQGLKEDGLIEKIGVSIYDFDELRSVLERRKIDLVQAPFNCFDRRLVDSGHLELLGQTGIEVHVRSVFLQGALIMGANERPKYFERWQALFEIWDDWLSINAIDPVGVCLQLPLSLPNIDRIIVGVDSHEHLNQILDRVENEHPCPPDGIISRDPDLINPSRWKL